ncbi:hypothetical protein MRX96_003812 [Rhipicephalus microplus]
MGAKPRGGAHKRCRRLGTLTCGYATVGHAYARQAARSTAPRRPQGSPPRATTVRNAWRVYAGEGAVSHHDDFDDVSRGRARHRGSPWRASARSSLCAP